MATTEKQAEQQQKKPKQGRSPSYPSMSLKEAMGKAKALYDAEGKYPAPMPSAFTAWGYGAKSSGGRETRATLGYFGLTTVEGDNATGKVKLTEKALRAILDEREDQTEKNALIREFALTPAIHKTLFQQYPEGIKSDATVEHFLMFEQGYNKSAAAEVVAEFKATADYAGLYKPASVVVKEEGDEADSDDAATQDPPADPPEGQKGRQVKIMPGERVVFTEESGPSNYLKLLASGEVDETMLEALEDYVKRQKKRLGKKDEAAN